MSDQNDALRKQLDEVKATHEREQSFAALRDFAGHLRHFYLSLREEGFNATQALDLTKNYHTGIIIAGINRNEEEKP
jgi:aspartyl/asparaginyl-tRNA synthetase